MKLRGEWGQGWKSDPGPAQFPPSIRPIPWSHHPAGPLGRMLSQLSADHSLDRTIRRLKLPLPRVELQPFPPDWPRSTRPLPPQLLQPALQRYFLPDNTNPDSYR